MVILQPTNSAILTFCKPIRWLPENMLTKNVGPLAAQMFYKGPLINDRRVVTFVTKIDHISHTFYVLLDVNML